MAITKTNTPYEFLVRWNNGAVAGAHIRFLETISENGTVLTQKEGPAMPVSMAGEAGFPIADILTSLQAQALTERDAAVATLAAKDAQIVALQAQVGAYTPPASALGTTVTARQIRLALTQVGLRAQVEAAVAAGDQALKDWYEYANEFERNHSIVIAMGETLNVSDNELDQLFALAATL